MEEATIIQQDAVLKSEVLRDNFEIMEGSDPRLEYTDEELGTDDLIKQEIIEIVETKIEPTTSEDFKVVKSESFLEDFKINEGLEGPKEEFETGPIIQQEIIEIVETKIEPTTSKDFKVVKNESFLEDFKINEGLEGRKEEFETGPIIQQEIIETFDMKIEPTTSQNFFVLKPVKVDNEDDSYYKTTVSDDEPLVKREIVWVDEMNTENDEVVNIKMEQDCFGDGTSNAGGSSFRVVFECDTCRGAYQSYPELKNHKQFCARKTSAEIQVISLLPDSGSVAEEVNHTPNSQVIRASTSKDSDNKASQPQKPKIPVKKKAGKNGHACPHCKFTTSWAHNLRVHMMRHNFTEFVCAKCNHKTMSQAQLDVHMKYHEKTVNVYSCGKCGYKTRKERSYKTHMKIHDIPYSCGCGFTTLRSYELMVHKKQCAANK